MDRAHATAEQIKAGCRAIRTAWLMLGGYLCEFIEDRMWEPLGHDTLDEWLATPGVELKRTHARRAARVYRELVLEREVPPAELEGQAITKLDVVLPALKAGKVSWEDAKADCEALGRRDLERRYAGGEVNGKLDPAAEPERTQCPTCGSWVTK